jgi:RteC protein
MKNEIEKLKTELYRELPAAEESADPAERLSAIVKLIERTLLGFNKLLATGEFENDKEEMYFFKVIKPEIVALRMEEVFRFSLIQNKPIGTADTQQKYFQEEMKALQSFFRRNAFHYQYYKNNITEIDRQFFLRNAGDLPVLSAETVDIDMGFSTPMSYLVAKFIAYEHIQYYIIEQIALLNHPELQTTMADHKNAKGLSWTGDSINLVELAYGIWLTGQINNGNASIAEIIQFLEEKLKVKIGRPYRRWTSLSGRKRLSPTRFLDQMKAALVERLENELK